MNWLLLAVALGGLPGDVLNDRCDGRGAARNDRRCDAAPFFELDPLSSGTNLTSAVEVNGAVAAPVVFCQGQNASDAEWACEGETASVVNTGTNEYDQPLPLSVPGLSGVRAYRTTPRDYQFAATTNTDLGTGDIIAELLFKIDGTATTRYAAATADSASPFSGWFFGVLAGSRMAWIQRSAATGATAATAYSTLDGIQAHVWHHALFCGNRDLPGGAVWVLNGAVDSTSTITGVQGSLASLRPGVLLGRYTSPGTEFGGTIASLGVWEFPGGAFTDVAATTQAECLALARGRFFPLLGLPVPSVATRASITTQTTDERVFKVGNGWPAIDDGKGLYFDVASDNEALQSEDFSTSWSAVALTSVNTDAIAAPDGLITADGIVGNTTNTIHCVTQVVTTTAVPWTYSTYAKAGLRSFLRLEDNASSLGAYFNLSNCSPGTNNATSVSGTLVGDSWCRLSFTATATAGGTTVRVCAAEADNDHIYAGAAGDPDVYLWGAQIEALPYASNYIPTTTTSTTRVEDALDFVLDDASLISAGTAVMDWGLLPASSPGFPEGFMWDDGTTINQIRVSFDSSSRYAVQLKSANTFYVDATSGGTYDTSVFRKVRLRWRTNNVQFWVERDLRFTDTSAPVPIGLNRLAVGRNPLAGPGTETRGHLRTLRFYRGNGGWK